MTFLRRLAMLVAILLPAPLMAIPAWARLTGASCGTCHTPTRQLTFQGLEFLRKGHRLEETKFEKTDQKLENYMSLYVEDQISKETGSTAQMDDPAAALFSGGALNSNLSYFAEVDFLPPDEAGQNGGVVLDQGYLQYSASVLPGDGFLSVRAGRILPEVLRAWTMSAPGADQFTEALDGAGLKGNTTTLFSSQKGVDVKASFSRWEVAAGILNGSATGANGSLPSDHGNRNDFFLSGMWNITKTGTAVGFIHFDGRFVDFADPADPATEYLDGYTQDGLLVRAFLDKWRFSGGYFQGRDQTSILDTHSTNRTAYGLVNYDFTPTLGVYARVDAYDPDRDQRFDNIRQGLLGVSGWFKLEGLGAGRWAVEYSHTQLVASDTRSNKVSLQFNWAF